MKRLLLIPVLAISLLSCNTKHCWECTTTFSMTDAADTSYKETVCDKTEKEIRDMEKAVMSSHPQHTGSVIVTVKKSMSCQLRAGKKE